MDTDVFFPEDRGGLTKDARQLVRDVCGSCPVRDECLDYAVADPDIKGFWADTTPRERAQLRKKRTGYQPLPRNRSA